MVINDISPADIAFRRVRPVHVVRDPKSPDGHRASAAAFVDDSDGSSMSVYLKSIVFDLGLTEASVVDGKPAGWTVAAVPVQTLTDEQQVVVHEPVVGAAEPHPCDPAHCVVDGDKQPKARRDRIAKLSPLVHVVS
jgi:hypothetical protein